MYYNSPRLTSARSLPIIAVAVVAIALTTFGVTRWIVDARSGALPPLEVALDEAAAAPGALDVARTYASRVDTVVSITTTVAGSTSPITGSGVVVDSSGIIVTASHVVRDYEHGQPAQLVVVRFNSGEEAQADVAALDSFNDLAILRIDPAQVRKLVAAPLGDSDAVVVGSEILGIGDPFGYERSPSPGIVSGVHRVIDSRINAAWKIPDAIQHTAATNKGNSGGPLFNARGEVIGINQQIASQTQTSSGVSFAVASNLVKRALRLHQETGATSISYADLGIQAADVTPQLQAQGQLAAAHGAIIQRATGPAAAAQLATGRTVQVLDRSVALGDIVVAIDGRPIRSDGELRRVAAYLDADATVRVTILRGTHRETRTVRAVAYPIV